ncbi:hypothetical protein H6785_03470 [Candidatus Nomurabacteria bacterium]|nr:hypothetical protein [Candidatus Kaiserbacteria bacterium]MCB9815607.1 hypothetical protein [Candidatus Nomurabacteria bacterium]
MNREHIEKLLRINGVSPTSPDEIIRTVLLSARFKEEEVDTAIMVLREDVNTKEKRVDGLHKVFRTDESLKPNEISKLLGIDVSIKDTVDVRAKARSNSIFERILVAVMSILLAFSATMVYMYFSQVGPFHSSETISFTSSL